MPPQITRSEDEIQHLLDQTEKFGASGSAETASTNFPTMTYEMGVANALNWLFGKTDKNPLDASQN